ncbi:methionine--tRNA ligase, partial [Rickettsiales bacterium]|nr:methionine--tRNA ligase [Rickettsiales bacterium]MDA7845368.1 methionine--tRNA ligase [Rickettsiales bacterium]
NKLFDGGWIYKDKYKGWYAVRDEAFYTDAELVDGKAPTGAEVVWKENEAYFFKLSAFQDLLMNLYIKNPSLISPVEKGCEVVSFLSGMKYDDAISGKVKEGHLNDLCVSRVGMSWGIPVEQDPSHSIYVWIDALVNYLSALGYPDEGAVKYWNAANKIHVVGKDILRFHAVYWPAMLIAEQLSYDEFSKMQDDDKEGLVDKCKEMIFDTLVVHGWWTNMGEKISKSLGNVIVPKGEMERIKSDFDADDVVASDYFRYLMIRSMQIGKDGDYNLDVGYQTLESELCNNVGNLINRTIAMTKKNFDIVDFFDDDFDESVIDDLDRSILCNAHKDFTSVNISNLFDEFDKIVENNRLMDIIVAAIEIGSRCNSYIEQSKPWKVCKDNKEKGRVVLMSLYFNIVLIMQLLRFVIPSIAERFFDCIGLENSLRNIDVEYDKRTRSNSAADVLVASLKRYKMKGSLDMGILFPKKSRKEGK